MSRFRRLTVALTAAAMLSGAGMSCQRTQKKDTSTPVEVAGNGGHTATTGDGAPAEIAMHRPAGKPLSDRTRKGLQWLVSHQLPSGGWGQGDESVHMGRGQAMRDQANVADTSMALLALMRAGNTATEGEHAAAVRKGLDYVMSEIEASDDNSLYVTKVRGTRVQGKIGTYVDTFTALMVLTEAKASATRADPRIERATARVLAKIEKNQRGDGTWANQGWAPVLTQSIAAKSLNRAAQSGADVDDDTLERVQTQARKNFDGKKFSKGGAAGIDLYGDAAGSSALRDRANTFKAREVELERAAKTAATPAARAEAQRKLVAGRRALEVTRNAEDALLARLDDPAFIRGFGNNGGEEFLSYMLMSETLVARGGEQWDQWDQKITRLLDGVQNDDGSWTGHHCITGRTFCTAAALLVLMADRAPVPVAGKLKG